MQYKRLAAAVLFTLPLAAVAQTANVQLYGTVDAAVSSENNGVNGRNTIINSGNQSASKFGFRGTEDLGNGLKALFNLEAGVAIDTGAQDSAGLFQRRAVVGLAGDFGTVTIGREYSPIAQVAGATDISGQGMYGSNLSAFGTTGANGGRLTRRLSNSVNYKSASVSGFDVLATYSSNPIAAEVPTDPTHNLKGAGLEYNNGDLYIGAAYQSYARVAAENDKEYTVGAAYKFGDFEFKGNWMVADPQAATKFTQYNLGAAMAMGPGKVFVNLQQNKLATGERGNAFSIDYTYTLSKRTNLYTGYAKMRNNDNANFGLNAAATSLAAGAKGADPSVFNVGMRHSF